MKDVLDVYSQQAPATSQPLNGPAENQQLSEALPEPQALRQVRLCFDGWTPVLALVCGPTLPGDWTRNYATADANPLGKITSMSEKARLVFFWPKIWIVTSATFR